MASVVETRDWRPVCQPRWPFATPGCSVLVLPLRASSDMARQYGGCGLASPESWRRRNGGKRDMLAAQSPVKLLDKYITIGLVVTMYIRLL